MYWFKPFVVTKHKAKGAVKPKARSGHRIVCDDKYLYSYGGFNPRISDDDMQYDATWIESKPLFKELWKFNFVTQQWKRLRGQKEMPNELASMAVVLKGNILLVHGGTGVPFGENCSNQIYVCNLEDESIKTIPAQGDMPTPQYGQALICHGSYLYTVGGTTGFEYTCDIHRFDLVKGIWEKVYICSGRDPFEPKGRYRHELAFDGRIIYVLGGGTATNSFDFSEIPGFDIETNKWLVIPTQEDSKSNSVPAPRRCHGCVQYTDERGVTMVVISGGYNGHRIFSDIWRLDLSTMQWTFFGPNVLPCLYFHSAALTPEGRMYIFGGKTREDGKAERTDAVYSMWLTIPKLSEICWQALIHYYPDLKSKSPEELLSMSVPKKYVERIDNESCKNVRKSLRVKKPVSLRCYNLIT